MKNDFYKYAFFTLILIIVCVIGYFFVSYEIDVIYQKGYDSGYSMGYSKGRMETMSLFLDKELEENKNDYYVIDGEKYKDYYINGEKYTVKIVD